ncbi:hypothetical protein PAAG_12613 [Paracoccidioides lutzii Pb01]|uniref:Uncharacterized protein n=1 Tax=Paracoccidioides lutzii (strain ATCC MYA-826 / Pb01) TaxID=502779 RepID=A0A0A2UYT8_PARBA|nr:hypothetical protein PAAG_12613 [Paracoccidioides lutzii Pb01]KGQ00721.1 hypothetical protein PAAG_12613 [Paracoccidioides lutzii Pb01]
MSNPSWEKGQIDLAVTNVMEWLEHQSTPTGCLLLTKLRIILWGGVATILKITTRCRLRVGFDHKTHKYNPRSRDISNLLVVESPLNFLGDVLQINPLINKAAPNLLLLWAFLDYQDLWYGHLHPASRISEAVAGYLAKWLDGLPMSEIKFLEAIKILQSYALMENVEGLTVNTIHLVLHRSGSLVQDEYRRGNCVELAAIAVVMALPNDTKFF